MHISKDFCDLYIYYRPAMWYNHVSNVNPDEVTPTLVYADNKAEGSTIYQSLLNGSNQSQITNLTATQATIKGKCGFCILNHRMGNFTDKGDRLLHLPADTRPGYKDKQ